MKQVLFAITLAVLATGAASAQTHRLVLPAAPLTYTPVDWRAGCSNARTECIHRGTAQATCDEAYAQCKLKHQP